MIVCIRNRQKRRAIDTRFLRTLTQAILQEIAPAQSEIGIHLVNTREMTALNQKYLGHEGSTDVITFDHQDIPNRRGQSHRPLYGELFISMDDAIQQARDHDTHWMSEVVRYVIHGVLHLLGYDDLDPSDRRIMKRAEQRIVVEIAESWDLRKLSRKKK